MPKRKLGIIELRRESYDLGIVYFISITFCCYSGACKENKIKKLSSINLIKTRPPSALAAAAIIFLSAERDMIGTRPFGAVSFGSEAVNILPGWTVAA